MEFDDRFAAESAGRLDLSTVTAGLVLSGRYRLDSLLAFSHGVMTWRAVDQVLSRPVLVHLLEPEDERLGWVLQAARRAATVIDSRFLRVLDAQEASGQEPWSLVVCEYAVGDSLKTLLAAGPLTSQQAGFIVHEVAAALAPLHARGLFHLRISPDSVIITANGNIKIVGLLIDAALRPQAGEDQLSWSDQEAIDVNALGQLLYASMTGHWPVPPSLPQRPNWGLPAAPIRGLPSTDAETGEQGWPAPHELNRQIDPEASAVAMAVLRPASGLVGPSLHTADDVADSLAGVISMPGAEESLESLVREHQGMPTSPIPAVLRNSQGWEPTNDRRSASTTSADATNPAASTVPDQPAVDEPPTERWTMPTADEEPTAARQIPPASRRSRPEAAAAKPPAESASATRPRPVPAPPRQPAKPTGTLGRRWILILVGFVVVALVVLQVRGCDWTGFGSDEPTAESSAATPEPIEIVSAFDFDPIADGGSQNENTDQAHYAADGDPSTVWRTLTYIGNPRFGGLKPGAGMVFDLGREASVASVSLILDNQPTALQLMVPIESDPTSSRPPMNSVNEWRVVASDPAAGLQVVLTPEQTVTTRWVMVYLTELPSVGAGLYRSGIAEAYINR